MRYPSNLLMDHIPVIPLRPETTFLLLQDVHSPFWPGGWLDERAKSYMIGPEFSSYYEQAPAALANLEEVLIKSRRAGLPVAFSCLGFFPPAAPSPFQRATGWCWELSAECGRFPPPLRPGGCEPVFSKPGWTALTPQLDTFWQQRGITNVVLAGSLMEFGIRQTALALADGGYRCLVLSDATTALTQEGRARTQQELNHGLIKLRYTAEYLLLMKRLQQQGQALV